MNLPAEDGLPQPQVLVAEDDPSTARLVRLLLEQSGYGVTVVGDGAEVLRLLETEGAPDLLLLDWMLPGASGLELCHAARQRWDALRLPILMVTARADPESVYAAFDAGASDYVAKPFRGAELRARIAAHLRTARLHAERARMEAHLRERDRLLTLGLLAGGVAHDLNNPLAAIRAHAELLLRRGPDPATGEELRGILEATGRCARIVSELLNFARRHPAERTPVSVPEVLRSALSLRERHRAASGVELSVELDAALPPVSGDAHQLRQLFLNILVNAEQALGTRGGKVRVAAVADGGAGAVEVEIWNDGPPIPAGALPRLFEPLFTTKSAEEGTGLGLYVCHRIAREHGGEIRVRSGDEGTAFVLRLPADASR